MTDYSLVSDYAAGDFTQFSVTQTRPEADLEQTGHPFGILTDESGRPARLVTPDGSAPAIQITADTPMERMTKADVTRLIDGGLPGLVVMDEDRCAGILSANAVISYLMANVAVDNEVMGEAPSDIGLPGDPSASLLTMKCGTCGTINTVPYYSEGETACVNGHPLTVEW